jgi:hypothetical protein
VLAASPVLFTAHYRSVVPAHNTPNNISREHQPIRRSDYELLHISAVVGDSGQDHEKDLYDKKLHYVGLLKSLSIHSCL